MKQIIPLMGLVILLGACAKKNLVLVDTVVPQLTILSALPAALTESSGLEMTATGEFWSHNDHGNKATLYAFNKTGQLTQTLLLNNAKNIDWEDLAKDEVGNLYIGDFGNNDNDRKDLVIYKILEENLRKDNNMISAEKITFTLDNQTAFPPLDSERFFDIEAFFYKDNALYLLTKDRSKPFKGSTRLYRLPNTAGNYTAAFLAEFTTDTKKSKGQITAADISPNGTKIALLANEVVWIISDFTEDEFFKGTINRIDLALELQLESVVFQDDCTLYLTNEEKKNTPAALYQLRTCQ